MLNRLPTSTLLPIELINFHAVVQHNNTVKLNWKTSTEINHDYFTLERSQNTFYWDEIGYLEGAGNSIQVVSYSFVDEHPILGTSYYRLKQTDFNGEFIYTPIVSVQIEGGRNSNVVLYPNPSSNSILLSSNLTELIDIRIFDVLGQEYTADINITVHNQSLIELDISHLSSGLYSVQTSTTTNMFYKY